MASSQKNSDGYDSMKESGRGQFKNSKFSAQKDNLSEIRESEGQEADESHLNIIIEKEIVESSLSPARFCSNSTKDETPKNQAE